MEGVRADGGWRLPGVAISQAGSNQERTERMKRRLQELAAALSLEVERLGGRDSLPPLYRHEAAVLQQQSRELTRMLLPSVLSSHSLRRAFYVLEVRAHNFRLELSRSQPPSPPVPKDGEETSDDSSGDDSDDKLDERNGISKNDEEKNERNNEDESAYRSHKNQEDDERSASSKDSDEDGEEEITNSDEERNNNDEEEEENEESGERDEEEDKKDEGEDKEKDKEEDEKRDEEKNEKEDKEKNEGDEEEEEKNEGDEEEEEKNEGDEEEEERNEEEDEEENEEEDKERGEEWNEEDEGEDKKRKEEKGEERTAEEERRVTGASEFSPGTPRCREGSALGRGGADDALPSPLVADQAQRQQHLWLETLKQFQFVLDTAQERLADLEGALDAYRHFRQLGPDLDAMVGEVLRQGEGLQDRAARTVTPLASLVAELCELDARVDQLCRLFSALTQAERAKAMEDQWDASVKSRGQGAGLGSLKGKGVGKGRSWQR